MSKEQLFFSRKMGSFWSQRSCCMVLVDCEGCVTHWHPKVGKQRIRPTSACSSNGLQRPHKSQRKNQWHHRHIISRRRSRRVCRLRILIQIDRVGILVQGPVAKAQFHADEGLSGSEQQERICKHVIESIVYANVVLFCKPFLELLDLRNCVEDSIMKFIEGIQHQITQWPTLARQHEVQRSFWWLVWPQHVFQKEQCLAGLMPKIME